MANQFILKSHYQPSGDQPSAIEKLSKGLLAGMKHQTMLGVTGSGKTFTMANIIQNVQKPTLILAHNKTLAAQLFSEFQDFFPDNAVEYFVSYYDYYQPEAYVPSRDLYIEKDSDINETIERYRSAATQALLTRRDVLIVASVSCIYGLGNPEDYMSLSRELVVGEKYDRQKLIRHLTDMQYERSDTDFYSGQFRVRGDVVDINVAAEETAIRVEYFGDQIEVIKVINM
jgi:excinuclease ABC subunit B